MDLTALFRQSLDIGFATDTRGAILAATRGAEQRLGYTQADFVGLDLPRLAEGADLHRFFTETGPPAARMHFGLQLRSKAGRFVTLDAVAFPLIGEAGKHHGWFIAGQDLHGAVAEARGSKSILSALVDSIGASVWSFDRSGIVATWSRACEPYFGVPQAEAEGKLSAVRLFSSPEEFRRVVQAVDEAGSFSGEVALLTPGGAARPNQLSVTRLAGADGASIGYTCASVDVSEQRRAGEFRRILFEQAGEAILVVDADSERVLEANAKACEIHRYERNEMVGLGVADLRPVDDAAHEEALRQLAETGRYESEKETHRRKDGSVFPCAINVRRVLIGGRRYSLVIVRDLSEQRRAEEYFRALFEGANSGIVMSESESMRVMAVNERAVRMLGYTREELMGMPVLELHPRFDAEAARAVAAEVLDRGEGTFDGLWHRRKDGTVYPIEASVRVITLGERRYLLSVFQDISDRVKTASELEEAKVFLEKLREEASDGIFLMDQRASFTYVNEHLCGLLGRRREDLLGATFVLTSPPDLLTQYQEVYQRTLKGETVRFRTEALRPDGTRVPLEVSVSPVSVGGRAYVSGIARGIAEQLRSEEALQKSEAKWRALVANAPDIIVTADRDGRILFVNRTVPGITVEEALGKTVYDYVLPEHHDLVRSKIEKVFDTAEPDSYEAEGAGAHGQPAWYSARVGPIMQEKKVTAVTLIVTDVTGRRRAEESLRYQKALLESQSEAAIEGILVVSAEGKMISFNRRFVEIWEIPPEVVASRSDDAAIASVLHKLVDPEGFAARIRHLYAHPEEESRDELALKDGRTIDRYSAPVRGTDGASYGRVWFFRDVTESRKAGEEIRRAYEDLKRTQAQLIRSEKLASIGMLVSGVAHEINNPLNVMHGNLKLLSQSAEPAASKARRRKVRGRKVKRRPPAVSARARKVKGMIRDALKAADHARRIIEDFRHFARDVRTAEHVDVNACLQEALTLVKPELGPGIRVVKRLGPLPPVRCIRGQMSQVFLNLIKNAAEAIEKKGKITLRTARRKSRVVIEVADTGRGMPEEVRKKLFEPFFTTKPVGKGLGLGLSISATIIHNHGGTITARSRPGSGSVFRVELPIEA